MLIHVYVCIYDMYIYIYYIYYMYVYIYIYILYYAYVGFGEVFTMKKNTDPHLFFRRDTNPSSLTPIRAAPPVALAVAAGMISDEETDISNMTSAARRYDKFVAQWPQGIYGDF